jgi:hypothetical protein
MGHAVYDRRLFRLSETPLPNSNQFVRIAGAVTHIIGGARAVGVRERRYLRALTGRPSASSKKDSEKASVFPARSFTIPCNRNAAIR